MKDNNKFTIALLIQGPLLSIGRSGKTSGADLCNLSNNDVIKFDCRKSINSLIKKYGNLFDQIILSTWSDELLEFENKLVEVYKFNKSKIPKVSDRKWIKDPFVSKNNILLQHYGCLYGVQKIKKNINFVLKVRTDQELNLGYIYQFLKFKNQENIIFVPKILRKGPYFEDFYFAGSKNIITDVKDLFTGIIFIGLVSHVG